MFHFAMPLIILVIIILENSCPGLGTIVLILEIEKTVIMTLSNGRQDRVEPPREDFRYMDEISCIHGLMC